MSCGSDACEVGQYKDPEQCCKDCAELCDPGRDQEDECLWSCGTDYLNQAIAEPSELISSTTQDPGAESEPMLNTLVVIVMCVAGVIFLGTVVIIGYVYRSRTRQTDPEDVVEEEKKKKQEPLLKSSIEETEQPNPAALRAQAADGVPVLNYGLIAQPEGSQDTAG